MQIGFLGAGEMGAGLAWAFGRAGHVCRAVATGRSVETQQRMVEAGMEPVEDLVALVAASDVIFSVLPPERAEPEAAELARVATAPLVFVEANAISPMRSRRIAALFGGGPVQVIDGGIIGLPPSEEAQPRLYVSGNSVVLDPLDGAGVVLRDLGPEIGRASAMKMVYAAMTKGTNALLTAVLLAGEQLDLTGALRAEMEESQPAMVERADRVIPALPSDAGRWVFEMREIADTFRSEGVPGGFHEAAAEIMALLDGSEFGNETRRSRDRGRTAAQTIAAVARRLG